jgi:hypothetical protein
MNKQIHQRLIGGTDSTNDQCIYKAFRNASAALQHFQSELQREKLPRSFWVLHILAAFFAMNALWQVVRWFG